MRVILEGDTRSHYCIMKRPLECEYEEKEDFQYATIKQELMIEDLFKNGVKVHLIDNYEEITEILRVLSKRYKQRTVFLSGSAYDYSPLSEGEATDFIQTLSKKLVENGYNIVNGYGLGVGTYVINGVAEYAYSNRNIKVGDHLTLMPFPLSATSDKELSETWEEYRKEMIEKCGIAVFLFGNKFKEGQVVSADGVEEEYEIAKKNGADLIPLGFTGWKAKELCSKDGIIKTDIQFENAEKTAMQVIALIEEINKEEF